MTMPVTIQKIDSYWVSYFGCRLEDLHNPKTTVIRHLALADYQGMFLFRHGSSCIVSVPSALVGPMTMSLCHHKTEEIFDTDFLANLFGNAVDRIIGPAWLGYADTTDFCPAKTREVRLLNQEDNFTLRRLAKACSEIEWEHSGIKFDRFPIFGCFLKDELVAVAGYEIWGERIAHIGVITHLSYRGRGYGKAVVSAITEYGLSQGLIMQYRTLQANAPSVAIARSLGYQEYAATIAMRLIKVRV